MSEANASFQALQRNGVRLKGRPALFFASAVEMPAPEHLVEASYAKGRSENVSKVVEIRRGQRSTMYGVLSWREQPVHILFPNLYPMCTGAYFSLFA